MKIRTRVFIGILLLVGIGFYTLVDWIVDDVKPQYRKATEEPLVDEARVLASLAATTTKDGQVDVELFRTVFGDTYSHSFEAQIYDFLKTKVDSRVYITDVNGIVIFDSMNGRDEGQDYSEWRDVSQTLLGEYGARTSRDLPDNPDSSVMYVASPIMIDGQISGVLSIGKPTKTANQFIQDSKKRIILVGTITCFSIIVIGTLISRMLTMPIERLTDYAKAVRDGKRVELPALGGGEVKDLGIAFEQMRDALEGKQYVEHYVQTLTHEVKSPLSAIQGAVELLKEEMPVEKRTQFLDNITNETERIKSVVERLLLLSSLESRKSVQEVEAIDICELLEETKDSLLPLIEAKQLAVHVEGEKTAVISGERFLVQHAISNILQNAIEFTPEHGQIVVSIKNQDSFLELTVTDNGPGIPQFAQDRVFERFYSLKRPDTGKKSSGLGLSLVQEVADLHGGYAYLKNGPETGAVAVISFPSNT